MDKLEEEAYKLFLSILKQKQDAIEELSNYMIRQGKYPHEYVIVDNWEEVLKALDENKLIPYSCQLLHKLALQTYLKEGE